MVVVRSREPEESRGSSRQWGGREGGARHGEDAIRGALGLGPPLGQVRGQAMGKGAGASPGAGAGRGESLWGVVGVGGGVAGGGGPFVALVGGNALGKGEGGCPGAGGGWGESLWGVVGVASWGEGSPRGSARSGNLGKLFALIQAHIGL